MDSEEVDPSSDEITVSDQSEEEEQADSSQSETRLAVHQVAKSTPKPAAKSPAKPAAKSPSKTAKKVAAKPIAKAKPKSKTAVKREANSIVQVAAKTAVESDADPADAPSEPDSEPQSESDADPGVESVADAEPETEPAIESPAEPEIESADKAGDEPEVERKKKSDVEEPQSDSASAPLKNPLADESLTEPQELPTPEEVPTPEPISSTPTNNLAGSASSITLHTDNLDVRKVLEMVSRQANRNILVAPGVTGKVTLDLREKSLNETLDAIARLCGLSVRQSNGFIYVSTIAEARLNEEYDLPVRVYHLNYVRSSDVEKMVKPLLSKKGTFTASPDSEIGLKSDALAAGKFKASEVNAGGNAMAIGEIVVVQDYEQVLLKVDRVIAQIDVQPIQILIEAVIVEVKLDKGMELGVNFALLDGAFGSVTQAVGVAGSGGAINAAAGFTPASVLTAGGKLVGTNTSGFAEQSHGLKFGFVDRNTTGFIRALETMGETKVLASPRLLVLNKQRSEIHLGRRLGYQTSTQTQTSTVQKVEFVDVGTQLRLRPFVSSDGLVRMEIRPERSTGEIDEEGIPQITTSQVTTNVMVPDGATIVIGGLIDTQVLQLWEGIPMLSRIPWVGPFFRETKEETVKRELIVLLTPRIWRPQCPEGLNHIGRPQTLGLEERVKQRPIQERRDGPTLYELTQPPMSVVPDDEFPVEMPPSESHGIGPVGQKKPAVAKRKKA